MLSCRWAAICYAIFTVVVLISQGARVSSLLAVIAAYVVWQLWLSRAKADAQISVHAAGTLGSPTRPSTTGLRSLVPCAPPDGLRSAAHGPGPLPRRVIAVGLTWRLDGATLPLTGGDVVMQLVDDCRGAGRRARGCSKRSCAAMPRRACHRNSRLPPWR